MLNQKWKSLAICLLASTLCLAEGGGSSNGAGGVKKTTDYQPFGPLGTLIAAGAIKNYLIDIESLRDKLPNEVVSCPLTGLSYPKIPEVYQSDFQILLNKQHLLKSDEELSATHEEICKDKKLTMAYGDFVLGLQKAANDNDQVTGHLIKTIRNQGGPIVVVIRPQGARIRGITEATWFDQKSGRIFWSPAKETRGMIVLMGRQVSSYLRHELTHVLLYRSLGSKYPKSGKVFHDPDLNRKKESYLSLHSTPEAAYIEGICFAMERGTTLEHPALEHMGNMFKISQFKDDAPNEIQFFSASEDFLNKNFRESNEAYVASSISEMFDTAVINSEEKLDFYEYPKTYQHHYLVNAFDPIKMMSFIDAISESAPSNLIELASAVNKASKSSLGSQWLKEFFLYDLEANLDLSSEAIKGMYRKTFLGGFSMSVNPNKKQEILETFLTPSEKRLEEELEITVKKLNAEQFSKEEIRSISEFLILKNEEKLRKLEQDLLDQKTSVAIELEAANRFYDCKTRNIIKTPTGDIIDILTSKGVFNVGSGIMAISDVYRYLSNKCDHDLTSTEEAYIEFSSKTNAIYLVANSSSFSFSDINELKKAAYNASNSLSKIQNALTISKIMKDTNYLTR